MNVKNLDLYILRDCGSFVLMTQFWIYPPPPEKKNIHVAIIFSNSDCVKYHLISFCNLQVLHLSGIVISFGFSSLRLPQRSFALGINVEKM